MVHISDLQFALRSLRRRPAYAAMVALILAVGIGASTAIFSVVDAVLVRPLPYRDPGSLVVVFADGRALGQGGRMAATAGDFADLREHADVFSGLAALHNESRRITSVEAPVVPLVHAVSANYFDVLGARPLLGRAFREGENEPGRDRVVVVSYGLWQAVFGSDSSLIGRTIDLDEQPYTVVGVMGREFYTAHLFAVQPGLWVPGAYTTAAPDRSMREYVVYGRLQRNLGLASAQASLTSLAAQLAERHPETSRDWSFTLVPLPDYVLGSFTQTILMLLAAGGLVLLAACANVAGLTLVRGMARRSEIAVRTALGASHLRIASQLLTESFVISLLGGAMATLVMTGGVARLARLIPTGAGVPFLDRVSVNGHVLVFALAASLFCGMLSGWLPAGQATRLDVIAGLRGAGRGSISRSGRRTRELLLAFQVALAVVVIAAACLMWRTLAGLNDAPVGFDPSGVLKLRTSLRGELFRSSAARITHFAELRRRLGSLPNVAGVSGVNFEPPTPAGLLGTVHLLIPGTPSSPASPPSAVARIALPGYFDVMRIPLLSGRGLDEQDRPGAPPVAVISGSMARRYFAGVNPVGRSFSVDDGRQRVLSIVGVVGDVFTASMDPTPQPVFYTPYAQSPAPVMTMIMRVPRGEPGSLAREAERIAWSLSPWTNVYMVETMRDYLAQLNWRPRFASELMGAFAAVALILAAVGVYAMISYTTLERRAELALRMALGARQNQVVSMVLKDGLRPALAGLALGIVASIGLTQTMASQLYGVSPGDPATLAVVGSIVALMSIVACLLPALRASGVDPQVAFREQP